MEAENEKFLDPPNVLNEDKVDEFYMDIGPPPAYMEVYTISDKVPARLLSPKRRQQRGTMFDSPRKRLLFVTILTFGSLMLSVLILLAFQKYMAHSRAYHSKLNHIKGSYEVILPHEEFPDKRDRVPYRIEEEVELTDSYGYITTQPFERFLRSSVLHEFDRRLTVVRSDGKCLIKPMRPDFQLQTEWDQIAQNAMTAGFLPRARCVREYWYMVVPAIPETVLHDKYGTRIAKHCSRHPAFRLLSKQNFMDYLLRISNSDLEEECFPLSCTNECPESTAREVNIMGCLKDCQCRPIMGRRLSKGKICTEITEQNCDLRCDNGYAQSLYNDCPICRCDEVASKRKRRNVVLPSIAADMKKCNVSMEVFEGVLVGDKRQAATFDYIYRCPA